MKSFLPLNQFKSCTQSAGSTNQKMDDRGAMRTIWRAASREASLVKPTMHSLAEWGTPPWNTAKWLGSGKAGSCSTPALAPHMNALRPRTPQPCSAAGKPLLDIDIDTIECTRKLLHGKGKQELSTSKADARSQQGRLPV